MQKTNLPRRLGMAILLALGAFALACCNQQPAPPKEADANAKTERAEHTANPPVSHPDAPILADEGADEAGDAPELPDMVDGTPAMMSEEAFLSAWREFDGVIVVGDGVMYRVISSGSGRSPKPTDTVRVIYRGTLMDGSVFDETKDGETSTVDLSSAIAGWREALPLMKEGDKWEIVIPSTLAYGEEGKGAIPANMPLVFEIELVQVMPG